MNSAKHTALRARTILLIAAIACCPSSLWAKGGTLTLICQEESDQSPTITRLEIFRSQLGGKKIPIRRTVPVGTGTAGMGVVLDRSTELMLADGPYAFRMIRGPEYRIITGTFTLEPTSLDDHTVQLPRMVDMRKNGWTSGDCLVVAAPHSLPLRMASEDLHLARTIGHTDAAPIPYRDQDEPIGHDPLWIDTDAKVDGGLVFYGQTEPIAASDQSRLPVARMVAAKSNATKDASNAGENADTDVKVAIENPFAWPLPVWLASQRVDGIFVLGDWLRLDRKVLSVKDGRKPIGGLGGGQSVGRWAEEIYRNALDAGLRLPPLAGGGSDSAGTPVGYNRLYVAQPAGSRPYADETNDVQPVSSPQEWWSAAWNGQSVATNGPMLRPMLGGKIPGHVFKATRGEKLQLQPELSLSVRDPVEYLEVIHNNRVHYSARLDEFAKAGGRIPPLMADQSGWVIFRVVTLHEDHYRAAISAPWYIEFDNQPRVSQSAVAFFQQWLVQYEQRLTRQPAATLKQHAPYIRAARQFWQQKADVAVD